MSSSRYSYLDLLKAICAFMVVFLHAGTNDLAGTYLRVLCRTAVPFFLMVTGFFLAKKLEKANACCVYPPVIKKTAWMFFIPSLLYILFPFVRLGLWGNDVSPFLHKLASPVFWMFLGFFSESPFAPHLWYLGAALYALIIMYLMEKTGHGKRIMAFMPLLLIIGLAMGVYSPFIFHGSFNIVLTRNFLLTALPCLSAGYILAKSENNLNKYAKLALPGAVICACLSVAERFVLYRSGHMGIGDMFLFTFPTALFMFVWALTRTKQLPSWLGFAEVIGRNHSANIYIYQFFLIYLWKDIVEGDAAAIVRPFAIFAATLLFSMLINTAGRKKN